MCVLIVTDLPDQTQKLKKILKFNGIKSKISTPDKIDKKCLTQFNIACIHPLTKRDSYKASLSKIRESNWQIPILIPFKPEEYIPNSFTLPHHITTNEIALTIQALLNRNKNKRQQNLKYKDLELNPRRRIARRRNQKAHLRNKEFGILEILIRNPNKIITKPEIAEILWDRNTTLLSNTLEVHVSRLRSKIDKGFKKKLIHTIPCVGYMLGYEED